MKTPNLRRPLSKAGIALVVVLGFLAVLLILAMAFAVSMRTERLASRNFLDGARARYMMDVAVARAMDDLNKYMNDYDLFYPDPAVGSREIAGFPPVACTNLLTGWATNYVPNLVWSSSFLEAKRVEWMTIKDPVSGATNGRVAYLAMDCSGCLNIHEIGTTSTKFPSSKVLNPPAAWLPDYVANTYSNSLTMWGRLFTLKEMNQAGICAKPPINFFTDSRFPEDYAMKDVDHSIARIKIAKLSDITSQKANIVQTFTDCGLPNPDDTYNCLYDYVDSNSIPITVSGTCQEAIPMFSEIAVSNKIRMLAISNYEAQVDILVEVWFPTNFPVPADGTYSLNNLAAADLTLSDTAGNALIPPAGGGAWVGGGGINFDTKGYCVKDWQFPPVIKDNVHLPGGGPLGSVYTLNATLKNLTISAGADSIVQAITFQNVIANIKIIGVWKFGMTSKSVIDPRINYRGATDWQTEGPPATLGTINQRTINYGAQAEPGAVSYYCRNSSLSNVCELGFLSIGVPWQSIALYDNPTANRLLNPVIDFFTISTNVRRQLVNINTQNTNLLLSVFYHEPIVQKPVDDGPPFLDQAQAKTLAEQLISFTLDRKNYRFSNLGKPPAITVFADTDGKRDGIILRAADYLGIQQNLFTVIVAAQTLGTAGDVLAEKRAMAVIWRDPFPNAEGNHRTFLKFFKWLTE